MVSLTFSANAFSVELIATLPGTEQSLFSLSPEFAAGVLPFVDPCREETSTSVRSDWRILVARAGLDATQITCVSNYTTTGIAVSVAETTESICEANEEARVAIHDEPSQVWLVSQAGDKKLLSDPKTQSRAPLASDDGQLIAFAIQSKNDNTASIRIIDLLKNKHADYTPTFTEGDVGIVPLKWASKGEELFISCTEGENGAKGRIERLRILK